MSCIYVLVRIYFCFLIYIAIQRHIALKKNTFLNLLKRNGFRGCCEWKVRHISLACFCFVLLFKLSHSKLFELTEGQQVYVAVVCVVMHAVTHDLA